jgi:hypothetical protein
MRPSGPDSLQSEKVVTALLKIAVLCIPTLAAPLVGFHDLSRHHLAAGIALIAGVLLQALIPPRKKALLPLLGLAVAFTLVYTILWK